MTSNDITEPPAAATPHRLAVLFAYQVQLLISEVDAAFAAAMRSDESPAAATYRASLPGYLREHALPDGPHAERVDHALNVLADLFSDYPCDPDVLHAELQAAEAKEKAGPQLKRDPVHVQALDAVLGVLGDRTR